MKYRKGEEGSPPFLKPQLLSAQFLPSHFRIMKYHTSELPGRTITTPWGLRDGLMMVLRSLLQVWWPWPCPWSRTRHGEREESESPSPDSSSPSVCTVGQTPAHPFLQTPSPLPPTSHPQDTDPGLLRLLPGDVTHGVHVEMLPKEQSDGGTQAVDPSSQPTQQCKRGLEDSAVEGTGSLVS